VVHTNNIAIVGDGFAAAVMVVHLLRQGIPAASLSVFGTGELGRGNAYQTSSPAYRLNVREDLPTIFTEDPLHFARWAERTIKDSQAKNEAGFFYRRNDFGLYMQALLVAELGPQKLKQIHARVDRLRRDKEYWVLEYGHESFNAKNVILATGNASPRWPCPVDTEGASPDDISARLIENPWPGDHLKHIAPDEDIILLGGGLTALDAINALAEQGHRARIDVISPRAIFPPAQAPWQRRTQPNWPDQLTPARLVRFMRHYLPSAPPQSSEWQCEWEELRPDLNQIWRGFTDYQRRILMKRFGWLWNLYRFRAGPQTIAAFEAFKVTGQIQFVLGRAKEIIAMNPKVRVVLNTAVEVLGDRIINCTGVGSDRLLNQLIADHCAIPDALAKAVAVDTQFRVLKPDQQPWNDVWMIGPATMGSLGDVVAASAIAKQAEQLASQIKLQTLHH
jgi:uncharacterized NAD(P)/FAD-binding protein YdhS